MIQDGLVGYSNRNQKVQAKAHDLENQGAQGSSQNLVQAPLLQTLRLPQEPSPMEVPAKLALPSKLQKCANLVCSMNCCIFIFIFILFISSFWKLFSFSPVPVLHVSVLQFDL